MTSKVCKKEPLKVNSLAMNMDTYNSVRVLRAWPTLTLSVPREGTSTTSLGKTERQKLRGILHCCKSSWEISDIFVQVFYAIGIW